MAREQNLRLKMQKINLKIQKAYHLMRLKNIAEKLREQNLEFNYLSTQKTEIFNQVLSIFNKEAGFNSRLFYF